MKTIYSQCRNFVFTIDRKLSGNINYSSGNFKYLTFETTRLQLFLYILPFHFFLLLNFIQKRTFNAITETVWSKDWENTEIVIPLIPGLGRIAVLSSAMYIK